MAFINGKEVMFSMQTPIANETGDSETMAISQKAATEELAKKADTEAVEKKLDKYETSSAYEYAYAASKAGTSHIKISVHTDVDTLARRTAGGQVRTAYPPLNEVDAVNLKYLNEKLAAINQATIHGDEIVKGGSLTAAIKYDDFGLFIVKGEDVTVTYTAAGEADNEVRSIKSDFHFIIKWKLAGGSNKILHLHLTSALQGYIKSFDGIIKTDISAANGSTQYGARVIKMNMKAVT